MADLISEMGRQPSGVTTKRKWSLQYIPPKELRLAEFDYGVVEETNEFTFPTSSPEAECQMHVHMKEYKTRVLAEEDDTASRPPKRSSFEVSRVVKPNQTLTSCRISGSNLAEALAMGCGDIARQGSQALKL